MERLLSLGGLLLLVGLGWLLSSHRRAVNWRLVGAGLGLQLLMALLVFVVPGGTQVFQFVNDLVVRVLDTAAEGSYFVFGSLALPPGMERDGQQSVGFVLAFQALPTIIFFSALMALLYWVGLMPRVVRAFQWLFTRLMGTSGAESLCAASNIFVGIESTVTVRPYLSRMTVSELHTVLGAGMATVASNVLALYVFMLRDQFPNIAGHLVSASLLSAPAALVATKLLLPETGTPLTRGEQVPPAYDREPNALHAVIEGANAGLKLCMGIVALLVAFVGLTALANLPLEAVGGLVNQATGWSVNWRLEGLLGYLGTPLALIVGVPLDDAVAVGQLIGERVVLTEVTSYRHLAQLLAQGGLVHPRSAVIATYALCGFAHVASLAIFVGGATALVPERAADLARVGPRALAAATLACLMTAAVAGIFAGEGSLLLGP
jgi:CNT family concentrative nucleoside transporter